jgi:hypothetical protein
MFGISIEFFHTLTTSLIAERENLFFKILFEVLRPFYVERLVYAVMFRVIVFVSDTNDELQVF